MASDLPEDTDTEEALKEFDFLVNAEDGEGAGEARSSGDGTEWGKIHYSHFKIALQSFRSKNRAHFSRI